MDIIRVNPHLTRVVAIVLASALRTSPTEADEAIRTFNIPSQDLGAALREFSRQSSRETLFSSDAVAHKVSRLVAGNYTSEAALRILLDGTSMILTITSSRAYLISAPDSGSALPSTDGATNTTANGKTMKSRHFFSRLAVILGICVSTAGGPGTACAQAAADEDDVEQVIVTGSRVIANGNAMPTPVTVVSTETLTVATPRNVIDALQSLPTVVGDGPRSGPVSAAGNSGGRTLNLRGVGTLRTLVLFDGMRVPPTSTGGEVSVDLIPSMLLQRVDVVTGGASAVYGSDAVSGVVNFITDRDFNGVKVDGSTGISERGDGQETRLGLAGGMEVFGRGHIEASYEFQNVDMVLQTERGWGADVLELTGAGTAANPFVRTINVRNSDLSFGGKFQNVAANGPLRDLDFRENGVLSPFVHGTPTSSAGFESGGDGEWFPYPTLQAESRQHKAFGRFDFDLTDNVHLFTQVSSLWSHNRNAHGNVRFPNFFIGPENAFLRPEYRQLMVANNIPRLAFGKVLAQTGGVEPDTRATALFGAIGLEGSLGDAWTWELGLTRARNSQETYIDQNVDRGRVSAALDAVVNPATGQIVCYSTLTTGAYPGCVPLNLFGPTSASQEALEYILVRSGYKAVTTQSQAGGSIGGSPFGTWAGPVAVALSAEWRELELESISNVTPNTPIDPTGIRYNSTTANRYQTFAANNAFGSERVVEAALEADVPLLADARFARNLNVNAGSRYTDYRTSGDVVTWKVGTTWNINDQVTFRGTRSRDIRAPNLNELFAPSTLGPGTFPDRHIPGSPQATSFTLTGSNINLVPEEADTWTAGIVLRPDFLPGFSLAVDWFSIRIDNAITTLAGTNIFVQDLCEASNGTSPLCSLIERPLPFSDRTLANLATRTHTRPENAAYFKTTGWDFEANYSTGLAGGNLGVRALVTYQPKSETQQLPGVPVLDSAGLAPLSKIRGILQLRYNRDRFGLSLQERFRSKSKYSNNPALVFALDDVPAYAVTNVTLTYKATATAEVFLNCENLFDKQPSFWTGAQSTAPGINLNTPPGDDIMGRYFVLGFRLRLE